MRQDAFSGFHPLVNLVYFSLVIGFSMFYLHPVCLAVSLFCAAAYAVCLRGGKVLRQLLRMTPVMVIAALLNPLFNHQGMTILAYLPDGNPLTLESVLYGGAAAVMLFSVAVWFSCVNSVMTSDKFVYLFGRAVPTLSLILSMALRFLPRFSRQFTVISDAQRCIGLDVSAGSFRQKIKRSVRAVSVLTTWALENAVETADSMRGRGYGLPGRSSFSIFRFGRRDAFSLVFLSVCGAVVLIGGIFGVCRFRYFPEIEYARMGTGQCLVFAAYLALGIFPPAVKLREEFAWKSIESRV